MPDYHGAKPVRSNIAREIDEVRQHQEEVMKVVLCVVLFFTVTCAVATFGQDDPLAAAMSACGPTQERLRVTPDSTKQALAQPEPGKALLFIIQDNGFYNHIVGSGVTYKVGIDGAWIGGINRHSPYVAISLTPGEHHLCANWQSRFFADIASKAVTLAHVDAEPDKTYYFRIRQWESQTQAYVDLDPVDSDQGKLLIAATHVKK